MVHSTDKLFQVIKMREIRVKMIKVKGSEVLGQTTSEINPGYPI